MKKFLILFFSFSFSIFSSEKEVVGCKEIKRVMAFAQVQNLILSEPTLDEVAGIHALKKLICDQKDNKNFVLYYANGQVATYAAGKIGAWWYYPNGQKATSDAGEVGGWWYYPNGRLATSDAGEVGGWWYYPNGRKVTTDADEVGGWWYYPNGKKVTSDAGEVGGWWYYPNGKKATSDAGEEKAWWFYSNGRKFKDAPHFTKEQLLEVPAMMLWLLEVGIKN